MSTNASGFGTEVRVSCPRGYEFVTGLGPSFQMRCEKGGQWNHNRIPPCQPRYCDPVLQIPNGIAIWASNVTFGGVSRYECQQGFSFPSGKQTEEIFCTEDGKWTPPPVCKAQTCPALPPFLFGERKLLFGDGTGYGTILRFKFYFLVLNF